jgi:hypothetical protein
VEPLVICARRATVRALAGATVVVALLAACGQDNGGAPTQTTLRPAPTGAGESAFPGPDTTGVPADVELEPSGDVTVTEDGAVVDGLDIDGCVVIAADDVTISNSRITCTDSPKARAVRTDETREGLTITDTEVDGGGVTDIGIDVSNVTITRVNVHGVNDGIRLGSNITVEDSWVHDLVRQGELHPDAIQGISAQDIVIRGNALDPRDLDAGDLGNAAIMLGSEAGTKLSRNVVIEDNLLNGGNYSINIRADITAEDFTIAATRSGPTRGTGRSWPPAASRSVRPTSCRTAAGRPRRRWRRSDRGAHHLCPDALRPRRPSARRPGSSRAAGRPGSARRPPG